METSVALVKAAREINEDALGACRLMARELGIPDAELAPPSEQAGVPAAETRAACTRVRAEIDKVVATLNPTVRITIVATPAVCTVSAEVEHRCVETCEQKTYTETELRCTPGKLSGVCGATCSGSCSGTCSLGCRGSCSATCTGTCSGRMSGKCEGTCGGVCDGTCSAMVGADGRCSGTCTGTCHGTCTGKIEGQCDARCEGSCSATCTGECTAMCSGRCTGGCSIMYQAPRCEEYEVTYVKTECEKTCETKARCEAMCTEPQLSVAVASNLADEKMKAAKLIAALKVGLPKILKVLERAGNVIKSSGEAYASALNGLPRAVIGAGLQAGACVIAAGQATGTALGQINASLEVSVTVQASAYARVGG